jgi:glycosyltransferase involved in cell wall biosynthesis
MPKKIKTFKAAESKPAMNPYGQTDGDGWKPEDLKMFKFLREVLNHVNIAYVSTFPPQECGIATFTRDLASSIAKYTPFSDPMVMALTEEADIEPFPKIVKSRVKRSDLQSHKDAAKFINDSDITAVSLQHEYGIYGGPDGEHVLAFLERVDKPVIATLHTVLFSPSHNQKRIVQHMGELASALVVMVKMGKDILVDSYGIPPEKVHVIPHGVPNVHRVSATVVKKSLGLSGRTVISTFGLINRGKGIEYAIKAMPAIVKKHPSTIYLVLGETHPGVRNYEGESYRKELIQLVAELGLERNVRFNNRFLSLEELVNYLCATDVYITPYVNRDQITSGTLAYALGCGKAIISTPYLYAEEVLSGGRGMLVDFRDPDGIAEVANNMLANNALRERMETKAYRYGRRAAWFNVAIDYLDLMHEICRRPKTEAPKGTTEDQRRPTA